MLYSKNQTKLFRFQFAIILLFFSGLLSLYAQPSAADSLRIEGYYSQLGKHCYVNLDSSLHYVNKLLDETDSLVWTQQQAYAYLWGILCSGYHDQIDLKYELLQGAEKLLAEKGATLEPDILAATDIDVQMHWGDYYMETGGYNGALEIYESLAKKLENKTDRTDDEFQRLVICYQYLANIHKLRGSYKQAIDFHFQAINFERQYYAEKGASEGEQNLVHSRIASAYRLMGEKNLALSYYRPAFENVMKKYRADPSLKKSRIRKYLVSMGLELGVFYQELNNPDSALYYLEQVESMIQDAEPLREDLQLEKAKVFSQLGQYAHAQNILQVAIVSLQKESGFGNMFLLGRFHNSQGDIYRSQGKYTEALQAYQQALHYLAEDFETADLQQNPEVTIWMAPRELLYTLTQKAQLLLQNPPDDAPAWLDVAWATATAGMDLVDSIKVSYTSDYDKQYLLDESYKLYELALDIAHQGGDKYAAAAFQTMERSKAIALFAAVRDLHARSYAQVPEEQLEKMRRVQYQLAKVDAQLEKITAEAQQIELREKRLQLKGAYQDVIDNFELNYPDYYQLKYNQEVASLADITGGDLLDDQMLIEYFVGEQHLYASVMKPGSSTFRLHQLAWSPNLKQWAIDLKEDIYQRNDQAYREKAFALYQTLLAPCLDGLVPERLLIIPDGVLGYLPFDILLTEEVQEEKVGNFRNYPFLMRETTVSQNFSLTMLREMQHNQSESTEGLLAIAPEFPRNEVLAERNQRDILGELLFNRPEAEAVLASFQGKLMAAQEATKQQFLEWAPGFRIYHIASHAVVDDETPNNSYIAFTNSEDNTNNQSKLYSYEILAQSFPADLVVLSACETGLGKVLRGEGIMSLARAFSYAGAKSLVTSLWNINDQSGQQLMDVFYQQLKTGLPKDEALRQAKLAYLETAPDNARTHPKYWAAFVPSGNMEPIKTKSSWKWGFLAIGLAVMGLIFLQQRKT